MIIGRLSLRIESGAIENLSSIHSELLNILSSNQICFRIIADEVRNFHRKFSRLFALNLDLQRKLPSSGSMFV